MKREPLLRSREKSEKPATRESQEASPPEDFPDFSEEVNSVDA